MPKGNFKEGYRDGWAGVAGTAPLPNNPTRPPPGDPDGYEAGFLFGRADALERGYKP
jgi:hypothetical protein